MTGRPSKIGLIRDEIERIGASPPEVWLPRLDVSWHFAEIFVQGKRIMSFPFEQLLAVLKKVPSGGGEEAFWREVDATDFDTLYENQLDELRREWKREDQRAKKVGLRRLATTKSHL